MIGWCKISLELKIKQSKKKNNHFGRILGVFAHFLSFLAIFGSWKSIWASTSRGFYTRKYGMFLLTPWCVIHAMPEENLRFEKYILSDQGKKNRNLSIHSFREKLTFMSSAPVDPSPSPLTPQHPAPPASILSFLFKSLSKSSWTPPSYNWMSLIYSSFRKKERLNKRNPRHQIRYSSNSLNISNNRDTFWEVLWTYLAFGYPKWIRKRILEAVFCLCYLPNNVEFPSNRLL